MLWALVSGQGAEFGRIEFGGKIFHLGMERKDASEAWSSLSVKKVPGSESYEISEDASKSFLRVRFGAGGKLDKLSISANMVERDLFFDLLEEMILETNLPGSTVSSNETTSHNLRSNTKEPLHVVRMLSGSSKVTFLMTKRGTGSGAVVWISKVFER